MHIKLFCQNAMLYEINIFLLKLNINNNTYGVSDFKVLETKGAISIAISCTSNMQINNCSNNLPWLQCVLTYFWISDDNIYYIMML